MFSQPQNTGQSFDSPSYNPSDQGGRCRSAGGCLKPGACSRWTAEDVGIWAYSSHAGPTDQRGSIRASADCYRAAAAQAPIRLDIDGAIHVAALALDDGSVMQVIARSSMDALARIPTEARQLSNRERS